MSKSLCPTCKGSKFHNERMCTTCCGIGYKYHESGHDWQWALQTKHGRALSRAFENQSIAAKKAIMRKWEENNR